MHSQKQTLSLTNPTPHFVKCRKSLTVGMPLAPSNNTAPDIPKHTEPSITLFDKNENDFVYSVINPSDIMDIVHRMIMSY